MKSPPASFTNFLNSHLWETTGFTTKWMQLGLDSEPKARAQYSMQKGSKVPGFSVRETGLWVNNKMPELACSPDGLVTDPSEVPSEGILEIKTLKIFQSFPPSDLKSAVDSGNCLKKTLANACFNLQDDGSLKLKTSHLYYYQVQFQMLILEREWCDFVLYSPKGEASIERIRRDDSFKQSMISPIQDLWRRVYAPELFEMRVPRGLTPFLYCEESWYCE
jgi:hypothetical protein